MTIETAADLIDALGGSAFVANQLSVEQNTVGNWRKRGIPAWAVPAMQSLCDERTVDPGAVLRLEPRRLAKARAA